MLKMAVLVSGGGTNLQAIIDSITNGTITNAEISVVISNNANAYALERAKKHGIEARCISPKQYETREAFNEALLAAIPIPSIESCHKKRTLLQGEVTSPINPKPGCRFAARCPLAKESCRSGEMPLVEVSPGHFSACPVQG